MQVPNNEYGGNPTFPFSLEDLIGWTIRREDGTSARFTLAEAAREEVRKKNTTVESKVGEAWLPTKTTSTVVPKLSEYCAHTPKDPIFESADTRGAGPLRLYVGDAWGAKQEKENFDFVIDGGDVISPRRVNSILEGDDELIKLLDKYTVETPSMRLLKIDWTDRHAPDVIPAFWTALDKLIVGDVMTCCQGGHGRSGTAFVCLLLNNAPDYDALDAIIHLRAVHCPRAIESKVQHEYIDDVAKFLKRKANGLEVGKITNYKDAFLKSSKPTAIRMRKILGWG